MHRVKGLEFDYVFAVAVNKKVLPFGTRDDFEDDISLEEFRTGEKCLLYVAFTRARKSSCMINEADGWRGSRQKMAVYFIWDTI